MIFVIGSTGLSKEDGKKKGRNSDTTIFVRRLYISDVIVKSLNFNTYNIKVSTMLIIFLSVQCRSLQYGNQFIYQSMPRMLTLWLDYGAKAYEWEKGIISCKNCKGH